MYKSTDFGVTWFEIGQSENFSFSTAVPNAIMRNDIVPTDDDLEANPPIVSWQGVFDIKTDPNHQNWVYVTVLGQGKGLYKSMDNGNHWSLS